MPCIPKKLGQAVAATGGLLVAGYATFTQVKPEQFGLRETAYIVTGHEILKPKVYMQFPFVQYTHKYQANTQTIDFNAGSCRFIPTCKSTGDQNPLTSELVLNYRVLPEIEKLKFHRWEMEKWIIGADGYWPLTSMLNTSANAILGQKSMAATLNDPKAYLAAVYADLSWRLKQNNFPVEIESLELKGFETWFFAPTRTVSYNVLGPAVAELIP